MLMMMRDNFLIIDSMDDNYKLVNSFSMLVRNKDQRVKDRLVLFMDYGIAFLIFTVMNLKEIDHKPK